MLFIICVFIIVAVEFTHRVIDEYRKYGMNTRFVLKAGVSALPAPSPENLAFPRV